MTTLAAAMGRLSERCHPQRPNIAFSKQPPRPKLQLPRRTRILLHDAPPLPPTWTWLMSCPTFITHLLPLPVFQMTQSTVVIFMEKINVRTELTEWVRLYTKDLYAWAYRKTSDRELSENLVQEAFLAAAESIASYKQESQPKAWLIGILKNKIAEHYRKTLRQSTTTSLPSDEIAAFFSAKGGWQQSTMPHPWQGEADNLTDLLAFNKVLDGCIEHLPSVMNACIRLKFLVEKKGELICREQGITTTSYWQLFTGQSCNCGIAWNGTGSFRSGDAFAKHVFCIFSEKTRQHQHKPQPDVR